MIAELFVLLSETQFFLLFSGPDDRYFKFFLAVPAILLIYPSLGIN